MPPPPRSSKRKRPRPSLAAATSSKKKKQITPNVAAKNKVDEGGDGIVANEISATNASTTTGIDGTNQLLIIGAASTTPPQKEKAESNKKSSAIIIKPSNISIHQHSLLEPTTTTTITTYNQHHQLNNNTTNKEDDNALVLAAEAAAAAMGELPHNTALDDIPMGLLDSVTTKVDVAANILRKEEGGGAYNNNNDNNLLGEDLKNDNKEDEELKQNDDSGLLNPLGVPSSQVQTFISKVPQNSEMSTVQKNFLSHYYYNGGLDNKGETGGGNALLLNDGKKGTAKKGDNEDEEEIVEDDGGDNNVGVASGADKEKNSNTNEKENISKKKDGGNNDESTLAPVAGEIEGENPPPVSTLRTICQSIPRTLRKKKSKVSKIKGDMKLKNEEEMAIMMDNTAEPTATATMAKLDEGSATNYAEATSTETTTTTTLAAEEATGPQVRVDEDGQIVIAQDSLLPNPETRQSTAQIDQELGGAVVDEGETPTQLGAIHARYDSYTTQPRTAPVRWSVTETKAFYNALRQCGTDFSMMQMFLVGRTRSQLKRKYKVESRKNARLVDMALNPRTKVKLDLSVFGNDLVIPTEVPAIKVLPPSPAANKTDAAAAVKAPAHDDRVVTNVFERNRKSMEQSFDHLFEEEEGDIGNDGAAAVTNQIEQQQKGKSDAQQTLVPPVIAPTSKIKAKRPRFKVKQPKKSGKKVGVVTAKKK